MRSYIYCIILAVLCSSCNSDDQPDKKLVAKNNELKSSEEVREDSIRLVANATSIPDSLLLIDIQSSKNILFKDIVESGTIYFYFSNVHCDACVMQELKLISTMMPTYKMILLAAGTTKRNLRVYLRSLGVNEKFRSYLMEGNSGNILGRIMVPTMFKLSDDLRPYAIHFSRLGVEDSTKAYLSAAVR
jgi:hypothetical protein